MTTFAIATLGCKVNTYESQGYENILLKHGYTQVSFKEKADIYIINTCAVTNTASSKSRQKIHQAHTLNKEAIIVAVGCYVQSAHEQVQSIDGVNILIGSTHKMDLLTMIENALKGSYQQNAVEPNIRALKRFEALPVQKFAHQTRAFLKIQDGCNQFCSYCIIPFARGVERSMPIEEAIETAKQLAFNGHQEIVLSGIHTGRYGNGYGYTLLELLQRMCNEVEGLKRIRISSIEMNELSDELLLFIKDEPKIARHLHIPIQSANDTVLQHMNRPYDVAWFQERMNYIRSLLPEISISSDVITGFPQESEEQFQETLHHLRQMNFSFLHIFPYSKRDFTKAAEMKGHLDNKTKKERASLLAQLSKELYTAYKQKFVGKNSSVIFEKETDGLLLGHSSEYLEVTTDSKDAVLHEVVEVTITALHGDQLYGICTKEDAS